MKSLKSYLIRAVRDWTLDNGLTPYILVNATVPGVIVPERFAKDGRIVLNIHPRAVNGLELNERLLSFGARFAGRGMRVEVPVNALLAVYAKEHGQGITFPEADIAQGGADARMSRGPTSSTGPHLRVVK